jgi:hypothetical protein
MNDNDNIQLNYDELVEDIFAKQLVLETKMACVQTFLKFIIKELCKSDGDTKRYIQLFEKLINESIDNLKVDNPIFNQIMDKKIKKRPR